MQHLIPLSHFIAKDQEVESSCGKVMSAYAGQSDRLSENYESFCIGNMTPQFTRDLSEICISESDKKCKLSSTRPHSSSGAKSLVQLYAILSLCFGAKCHHLIHLHFFAFSALFCTFIEFLRISCAVGQTQDTVGVYELRNQYFAMQQEQCWVIPEGKIVYVESMSSPVSLLLFRKIKNPLCPYPWSTQSSVNWRNCEDYGTL